MSLDDDMLKRVGTGKQDVKNVDSSKNSRSRKFDYGTYEKTSF